LACFRTVSELDSLETPIDFVYLFTVDKPFRDLPKSVRRSIRGMAKTAHDRELAAELHRIDELFARWRSGHIGPHELNDAIHEFHNGPSRRLWNLYVHSDPTIGVANAISRGILLQSEVPLEVMQELRSMIAAFSERLDENSENDDE
jgi:hypothetical protein